MEHNPDDLLVYKGYSPNKRAALAYSALIILVSSTSSANMSWEGVQIDLTVACILAWVAATYYSLHFFAEWRIARAVNSEVGRGGGGKDIDTRLKQIAQNLERVDKGLSASALQLEDRIKAALSRLDSESIELLDKDGGQAMREISRNINRSFASQTSTDERINNAIDHYTKTRLNQTTHALEELSKKLGGYVSGINGASKETAMAIKTLDQDVSALRKDFARLAGRLGITRKLIFWGDFSSVLSAWVLGTFCAVVKVLGSTPWERLGTFRYFVLRM
jgi:hypothetical protein